MIRDADQHAVLRELRAHRPCRSVPDCAGHGRRTVGPGTRLTAGPWPRRPRRGVMGGRCSSSHRGSGPVHGQDVDVRVGDLGAGFVGARIEFGVGCQPGVGCGALTLFTMTSWLVRSPPRQFMEMWENSRCSILFHSDTHLSAELGPSGSRAGHSSRDRQHASLTSQARRLRQPLHLSSSRTPGTCR